jgi:hypothetical protein
MNVNQKRFEHFNKLQLDTWAGKTSYSAQLVQRLARRDAEQDQRVHCFECAEFKHLGPCKAGLTISTESLHHCQAAKPI